MTEQTPRLYGLPDAERLCTEIGEVYEAYIVPFGDASADVWTIEEWTCHPVGDDIMSAARIVEFVLDDLADNCFDSDEPYGLVGDAVLVAAAEVFRSQIVAAMPPMWQADEIVATHTITHDEGGEPLLDGEPLYTSKKAVIELAQLDRLRPDEGTEEGTP